MIMQVYTVHKRRILVIAMATGTLVLLVAMAFIGQPSNMDVQWNYIDESGVRWKFGNFGAAPKVVSSESSKKPKNSTSEAQAMAVPNDESTEDDEDENPNNEINPNAMESETVYDNPQSDYDEYDSDDDEDNENSVFRDGDFDVMPSNVSVSKEVLAENDTSYEEIGQTSSLAPKANMNSSKLLLKMANFMKHSVIGSFGFNKHVYDRKLQAKEEPEDAVTKLSIETQHPKTSLRSSKDSGQDVGIDIVEDSIFWSKTLERRVPKGLGKDYIRHVQKRLRRLVVTDIAPPTWNRCGRPKNQYLTLGDGSHVCARYRAPHDYLVQGEVMSFYLARLLAMDNIPIVVLSKVNPQIKQWGSHRSMEPTPAMTAAGWEVNATVALVQWIDGLERDKMPKLIASALRTKKTISFATKELHSATAEQLLQLVQWSDLIVFDYITGNYDRVASMQDAADKEQKPAIMQDTIHNLVKSRKTGGLWLIDNESGLLDAYSLMYSPHHPNQGKRFISFQSQMLRTTCLFRRKTANSVKFLHNHGSTHQLLIDYILREEPLFGDLPDVTKNREFIGHFQQRIDEVYQWMLQCRANSVKR